MEQRRKVKGKEDRASVSVATSSTFVALFPPKNFTLGPTNRPVSSYYAQVYPTQC